jgi:hypothetical protein
MVTEGLHVEHVTHQHERVWSDAGQKPEQTISLALTGAKVKI